MPRMLPRTQGARRIVPLAVAIFACASSVARPSFANDDNEVPSVPPPNTPPGAPGAAKDGFGGQIVLVDLLAAGVGGGLTYQSRNVLPLVATMAIGAPFVHLVHDDAKGALPSFLLHATLPVGLAYLSYAVANCEGLAGSERDTCAKVTLGLGALAGVLTAMIIDAAALAHPPPKVHCVLALAPLATASRNGALTLGVAGRF
jgi:hypothetical protein